MLFAQLQKRFADQYQRIFDDKLAPKTIVVIPSLTLDHEILSKIKGHFYYEERMLCLLLLLRMPETRVTFVSSIPISPLIIDYYLHMLPGITPHHARNRLTLLNCYDSGNLPLTIKVLKRPRLIERIRKSIQDENAAHLVFFNTTDAEKELALALNTPIYGSDPIYNYLGSKSGCRQLFKDCDISLPFGFENIYSENDIVEALSQIHLKYPNHKKAVVKINEGFSGDGNAVFSFENAPNDIAHFSEWIKTNLKKNLKIVATKLKYQKFIDKIEKTGGIVEIFIEGETVMSPSVQCRINPLGEVCIVSTHDQVLTGENNQVFAGATFPAAPEYAITLANMSYKIGVVMRNIGVLGRFGIDFMSVKNDGQWTHYALEINLRKGGTTHPFIMLQFLTDGQYDADTGNFVLPEGNKRYYFATDNLQNDRYKGLTPLDLLDIVMYHGLHYDHSYKEGVMFHLISALSQYGKIGLVSIGSTPERAMQFYQKVITVLDDETASH
jgi:hypothetical protein